MLWRGPLWKVVIFIILCTMRAAVLPSGDARSKSFSDCRSSFFPFLRYVRLFPVKLECVWPYISSKLGPNIDGCEATLRGVAHTSQLTNIYLCVELRKLFLDLLNSIFSLRVLIKSIFNSQRASAAGRVLIRSHQ